MKCLFGAAAAVLSLSWLPPLVCKPEEVQSTSRRLLHEPHELLEQFFLGVSAGAVRVVARVLEDRPECLPHA